MQDLIKYGDDHLVRLYIKEKNLTAMEVLFYRHADNLLKSALYWGLQNDDAQNLVQDTFYRVMDSLNKGKYCSEDKFYGWMLRIARNIMIDQKRRAKRGRELIHESFEPSYFGYESVDMADEYEEREYQTLLLEMVYRHMEELPPNQKEIIMLRFFEELSFKEIAAKLDISINTALGRMRYSLINLRKIWNEKNTVEAPKSI